MQRRRKKKASAVGKRPGAPGVKLDKSLPSLPPSLEETRLLDESPSETYPEATPDSSNNRMEPAGEDSRPSSSPSRQATMTGKETTMHSPTNTEGID